MLTPASLIDNQMQQFNSDFLLKLRNIYSAENYCLRRIPAVVNKIPRNELWRLLDNHLPVIAFRKNRIEKIFQEINVKIGGEVCMTFKRLISKAGTIIYYSKAKDRNNTSYELITTLLEISIYRSYIYNHLNQIIETVEKPVISAALKRSMIEEDDFFHALLRVKKQLSSTGSTSISNFQSIRLI